jgi:ATP-dependent DNA helicase RecG
MTITLKILSPADTRICLDAATSGIESQTMETKLVSGKMVSKALETICAFANTFGGHLFLGVEDTKRAQGKDRLFGIDENREAVDELLRKLEAHFLPKIENIAAWRLPCELRDGKQGEIVMLYVPQSAKVHSISDDGTWTRGEASNREMSADEIADLSYRRGMRSAESEPVDVDFGLLQTNAWRLYSSSRGLTDTGIADQLYRIGLAKKRRRKNAFSARGGIAVRGSPRRVVGGGRHARGCASIPFSRKYHGVRRSSQSHQATQNIVGRAAQTD